jgi:hypothetical protein
MLPQFRKGSLFSTSPMSSGVQNEPSDNPDYNREKLFHELVG